MKLSRQREKIRKQAVKQVEELEAQGVESVPFGHPLYNSVIEFIITPNGKKEKKTCSKCELTLVKRWNFCPRCGTKLFKENT
jgi:hypothetical protein